MSRPGLAARFEISAREIVVVGRLARLGRAKNPVRCFVHERRTRIVPTSRRSPPLRTGRHGRLPWWRWPTSIGNGSGCSSATPASSITAHYRKVAARLIQAFPEVVAPFREGKLCITSVVELARVITPENSAEVLPRFFHLSKQEAKAVAVEICPAAVVPRREVVTELPRAAPFHRVQIDLSRSQSARRAPGVRRRLDGPVHQR